MLTQLLLAGAASVPKARHTMSGLSLLVAEDRAPAPQPPALPALPACLFLLLLPLFHV